MVFWGLVLVLLYWIIRSIVDITKYPGEIKADIVAGKVAVCGLETVVILMVAFGIAAKYAGMYAEIGVNKVDEFRKDLEAKID